MTRSHARGIQFVDDAAFVDVQVVRAVLDVEHHVGRRSGRRLRRDVGQPRLEPGLRPFCGRRGTVDPVRSNVEVVVRLAVQRRVVRELLHHDVPVLVRLLFLLEALAFGLDLPLDVRDVRLGLVAVRAEIRHALLERGNLGLLRLDFLPRIALGLAEKEEEHRRDADEHVRHRDERRARTVLSPGHRPRPPRLGSTR